MKALKLTVASFVALAVLTAFSSVAQATTGGEQEQKVNQKVTVKCTTGSYGQLTNCEATGEQTAEQKQKLIAGKVLGKVHTPVNTALDFQSSVVAGTSILSGIGAVILKRKIA